MTAQPSKKQRDFLDWEMGAFFHFGIRTFYEGHRDWDLQEMPSRASTPPPSTAGSGSAPPKRRAAATRF